MRASHGSIVAAHCANCSIFSGISRFFCKEQELNSAGEQVAAFGGESKAGEQVKGARTCFLGKIDAGLRSGGSRRVRRIVDLEPATRRRLPGISTGLFRPISYKGVVKSRVLRERARERAISPVAKLYYFSFPQERLQSKLFAPKVAVFFRRYFNCAESAVRAIDT